MKEFTNVAGNVTSFAGNVNLFCPSWISCPGAWFERFSDILWHHFHPKRVVSFKERTERGWKSGARSLSWKSGWNPCTSVTTRRWIYPKTFFRFQERAIWKFPYVQLNFYIVNFKACLSSYFIPMALYSSALQLWSWKSQSVRKVGVQLLCCGK